MSNRASDVSERLRAYKDYCELANNMSCPLCHSKLNYESKKDILVHPMGIKCYLNGVSADVKIWVVLGINTAKMDQMARYNGQDI